jgi:hypothetical protein
MCDYSLAHVPNRLAEDGEQLVVHRFDTHTLGLAPAHRRFWDILLHPHPPAVCVPPGARLRLHDIPQALRRSQNLDAVEEVIFVQLSADAFVHRDAVRFANGEEILLQRLQCGQRVDVLSLDSQERATSDEAVDAIAGLSRPHASGFRVRQLS